MGDVAAIALLLFCPVSVIVLIWWFARSMRYYKTDGALLEQHPVHDEPFTVALPAGPPLWVMIRYSMERRRRSGRGSSYGVTIEVDAERGDTVLRHQRVMGGDGRRAGDAPVALDEPHYLAKKIGLHETRTCVIARIPAGGEGTLRGKITTASGTTLTGLCVFVKPPPK